MPEKAILMGNKIIVTGSGAEKLHEQGYYGEWEDNKLVLFDVEALYLLDNNKIILVDESNKVLTFQELVNLLLKNDPNIWLRYLLYSDLRRRGYVVKEGYGKGLEFRVYRRGAMIGKEPAKYLVYGLMEGKTISISELKNISNKAKLSNKDLIIAVIDRQGEITYYETMEITP
ncbi:MAG: tRNA-intron lyase [Candidatus Methanomethylicota archaeon]|jgi:tRNA-intron endonuclease|uniref:tRNA-intron lyase n=1 Tax=Thermoproteota archaeon TaxID=2056631 RepID=A0A523BAY7_9CREN|nr:MAG: tRNA-intron lyase [Candidatus Verstraetearchaeota archaeon]TDA38085.1 MAG: tRNA-intron lyase [Candidatus Verstraetearchaeota archaeon]